MQRAELVEHEGFALDFSFFGFLLDVAVPLLSFECCTYRTMQVHYAHGAGSPWLCSPKNSGNFKQKSGRRRLGDRGRYWCHAVRGLSNLLVSLAKADRQWQRHVNSLKLLHATLQSCMELSDRKGIWRRRVETTAALCTNGNLAKKQLSKQRG